MKLIVDKKRSRYKIWEYRPCLTGCLKSEQGLALVMILVLAGLTLAIMAALIYMLTSGTQVSGAQKRYKTALEAGKGGADLTYEFISMRGVSDDTHTLLNDLASLNPYITVSGACTGTNRSGTTYTGTGIAGVLSVKLNTPSTSWSSACNTDSVTIIPGSTSTYDLTFDLLGTSGNPTYTAYAKIVDTVEGNSGSDSGLIGKGVVSSGSGEISVMSIPYLYTIEMDAENKTNPAERAKLSVLYQY